MENAKSSELKKSDPNNATNIVKDRGGNPLL